MCGYQRRPEKDAESSPGVHVKVMVIHSMWVLETELRYFGTSVITLYHQAVSTPKHQAIIPLPDIKNLKIR